MDERTAPDRAGEPAAPDAPGLKRRAARDRLVRAGLKLSAGRPWTRVKVADVAGRAGMSKGAFFTHFASKDTFAAHLLGVVLDQLAQRVGPMGLSPEDAEDLVAGVLAVHLRFFQLRPEAANLIIAARGLSGRPGRRARQSLREHLDMVARLLRPALAAMEQPPELGRQLALAGLAAGCGMAWLEPWLGGETALPGAGREQLARALSVGLNRAGGPRRPVR